MFRFGLSRELLENSYFFGFGGVLLSLVYILMSLFAGDRRGWNSCNQGWAGAWMGSKNYSSLAQRQLLALASSSKVVLHLPL
jgi:hypothetical protein